MHTVVPDNVVAAFRNGEVLQVRLPRPARRSGQLSPQGEGRAVYCDQPGGVRYHSTVLSWIILFAPIGILGLICTVFASYGNQFVRPLISLIICRLPRSVCGAVRSLPTASSIRRQDRSGDIFQQGVDRAGPPQYTMTRFTPAAQINRVGSRMRSARLAVGAIRRALRSSLPDVRPAACFGVRPYRRCRVVSHARRVCSSGARNRTSSRSPRIADHGAGSSNR